MATLEVARAAARRRSSDHRQTVYVVKDITCDEDPRSCFFAADDEQMDTFYAGIEPLEAFEPE